MIKEKEYLEECLYDFFTKILSDVNEQNELMLIFENENGPRPVPPFLSVSFNNVRLLGTTPYFTKVNESKITDDENETSISVQKSKQTVERSCTLRGFGKSCEDLISNIRSLIEFDDYVNMLKSKGLVISQVEDILENSSNYSDDSETFYSMDFVLTYERVATKETEYIEHTKINSTSIKDSGNNDTNNRINVEL